MPKNTELVWYTPETNCIVYINYTSKKKKKRKKNLSIL